MTTTAAMTTTTKADTLLAGRSGLEAARRPIVRHEKKKASAGHSAFGYLTDGWSNPTNRAALGIRQPHRHVAVGGDVDGGDGVHRDDWRCHGGLMDHGGNAWTARADTFLCGRLD